MRILVTGATGLIGAEVLRQAIKDPAIEEVIALVRNEPEVKDPKIMVAIHKDFENYTEAAAHFKRADVLLWCLGISQTQVNKQQYEKITYDYLEACVRFCLQVNPNIRFIFVSGDGADRTEKSPTIFKRLKGKAENLLLRSGLRDVFIARPDAVRPKHKNKKAPFLYKLVYPLFPIVEKLAPHKIIWSDVLARALLRIAKNGYEKDLLENVELRELGKTVQMI